jgi:hypothetical protein
VSYANLGSKRLSAPSPDYRGRGRVAVRRREQPVLLDRQRGAIYNDLVKAIDEGLLPERRAVVDLMRGDLKTRK